MLKSTRTAKNLFGDNEFEIKSEVSVKADSLEVESNSTINGRKALSVVYNSKSADALAAYSLIQKDIKFCKTTLSLAANLSGGNLNTPTSIYVRDEADTVSDFLKSLTISFIITYGKCFAQADGRKVKLESKDIFKKNEELKSLHDFVIEQRNTYIAHAGITNLESAKTIILLDEDESRGEIPKLITRSNHMYCFEQKGVEFLVELLDYVEQQVLLVIKKRFDKIKEKELKNVSDEHLYYLARNNQSLTI